jgi:hypothetical protein
MAGSSGSEAGLAAFPLAGRTGLVAFLAVFRDGLAAAPLESGAGLAALLAVLAELFALCDLEEVVPAGAAFESLEDCATAGATSRNNENRPATVQAAIREPETGENTNFIVSL